MALKLAPQTKFVTLGIRLNQGFFDVSFFEDLLGLPIVEYDFLLPSNDEPIMVQFNQVVK
jgi:hypothetical protein